MKWRLLGLSGALVALLSVPAYPQSAKPAALVGTWALAVGAAIASDRKDTLVLFPDSTYRWWYHMNNDGSFSPSQDDSSILMPSGGYDEIKWVVAAGDTIRSVGAEPYGLTDFSHHFVLKDKQLIFKQEDKDIFVFNYAGPPLARELTPDR